MSGFAPLVPRRIAAVLDAAMAVSPVVAITGARTAGKSTLAAQITGRTGGTFELPAWSANQSSRVTKRPNLHLVDSGLAAHLRGITTQRVAPTDPAGAQRFGALLETFVVTEVIKQLGWSSTVARPFHYRTADGVEVDLVLEAADGRVTAIEIKAGSALTTAATSPTRRRPAVRRPGGSTLARRAELSELRYRRSSAARSRSGLIVPGG
ncbi:MAG: DUF4143 domain-containing protein [Pseudonocardiaceae bacterium]